MEIKVKIKREYGHDRIYPACEKADFFAEISGRKCFSQDALAAIRALGFTVIMERQEIPGVLVV